MHHLLIVDDEEDIREMIQYNLSKEGFKVDVASDGLECLEFLKNHTPDLILLDVMMPGLDGIDVCERIKQNPSWQSILICFLTARSEDYSQIAGLEAGGDDYISKPIKPKLLLSRINALLRRKQMGGENQVTQEEKGMVINRERYLVEKDGKEILLPRKEFELLALLASKPNQVFKRDIILEKVWGTDIVVGDRTIDVHIRKLREKIGDASITTVKGVGYKFNH
jgi:two-component system, OmpR family, alkaline phosphatase synthesis response regulator PhoP